jgi:ribose-phosphate pyrophosphokinase
MQLILAQNLSESFRDHFNRLASDRLGLDILPAGMDLFPSGEPYAKLKGNMGGEDVVLLQSLAGNVSEECMKMLLTVPALKRKGANSVTVAIPFAPFGRQDKNPLLAGDDFPMLLKAAGVDKVVTADLHSKRAEQFYTDHFGVENVTFLSNAELFADDIRETHLDCLNRLALGAPDGSDKPEDAAQIRAREITRLVFNLPALSEADRRQKMFGIKKVHKGVNITQVVDFTGDVAGRPTVTIDDMSDSGGTLLNAGEALINEGATETSFYIAHGLFDVPALVKILSKELNGRPVIGSLTVTDSAPGIAAKLNAVAGQYPDAARRVRILSNAPQFAAALSL